LLETVSGLLFHSLPKTLKQSCLPKPRRPLRPSATAQLTAHFSHGALKTQRGHAFGCAVVDVGFGEKTKNLTPCANDALEVSCLRIFWTFAPTARL
jgi:hypothetical protein